MPAASAAMAAARAFSSVLGHEPMTRSMILELALSYERKPPAHAGLNGVLRTAISSEARTMETRATKSAS